MHKNHLFATLALGSLALIPASEGFGQGYTTSTHTISTVAGAGCTFTINVQTGPSCVWAISGLPAWITLVPLPPPPLGSASILLTVAPNVSPSKIAHLMVAGQPVTVTLGPALGLGPVINSVTTAGSESPVIAPNTWVEIKGQSLGMPGDNRSWQSSDFVNNQMPTQLDSVGVTMNGESAHVGYISFNQINVLNLANGPVQIVVTVPPGLANGDQPIAVSSGGQVTLSGTLITDHN